MEPEPEPLEPKSFLMTIRAICIAEVGTVRFVAFETDIDFSSVRTF